MIYEALYPRTARAMLDALAADPFYKFLTAAASADAAESTAAMIAYLDYSLQEAEAHGILSFADDSDLGAAAWKWPLNPALERTISGDKLAFMDRHMGNRCRSSYEAIGENMHAQTAQWVPSGCWYLSIVGISPAAQGRGLGRELLEADLRRADEAGVPTYLETFSPRNKRFYERMGYREVAKIPEPVTGSEYSVLLRSCGGATTGP